MQSTLDTLPSEILLNVVSYLPDNADRSRLCRSSKSMHTKTQKALYESIALEWKGNAREVKDPKQRRAIQTPRLDLLFLAILENPQYATWIQDISLLASGFKGVGWSACQPNLPVSGPERLAERLIALLESFEVPHYINMENWIYGIKDNSLCYIMMLFILHCPNIRSLVLSKDIYHFPRCFDLLYFTIVNPYPSTLTFPRHLQTLTMCETDGPGAEHAPVRPFIDFDRNPWQKDVFFTRSSTLVEATVSLSQMTIASTLSKPSFTAESFPALKILRLRQSSIRPAVLGRILARTPHLETLDYDWWLVHESHTSHGRGLGAGALEAALSKVKSTLRVLKFACYTEIGRHNRVDEPDPHGDWFLDPVYAAGRCSFADFACLEELHMAPSVLFGEDYSTAPALVDVLPKQLKTLCFHPTNAAFDGQCVQARPRGQSDELLPYLERNSIRIASMSLENLDIGRPGGIVNAGEACRWWDFCFERNLRSNCSDGVDQDRRTNIVDKKDHIICHCSLDHGRWVMKPCE